MRFIGLLALLCLLPSAVFAEAWSYDLTYHGSTRILDVSARFTGMTRFEIDREAIPFLKGLPLKGKSGELSLPCNERCDIRYSFSFAEASGHPMDDKLKVYDNLTISNPALWLIRPLHYQGVPEVLLHFTSDGGAKFGTGIFPKAGASDTYAIQADHLKDMPWTVFGKFEEAVFDVPGARVQLAIIPAPYKVGSAEIRAWVRRGIDAVVAFYGKYPVPHALIVVLPRNEGGPPGTSYGDGGAVTLNPLRVDADQNDLKEDWVMTHEMVHLAFPMVDQRHHWMEEGLATYVEPIARLRTGELKAEGVFHDMVQGMPKGLPMKGDRGLDNTPTWGRTYWGGALFALLADKEIREKSKGKFGLDDALRAIVNGGGSMAMAWDFRKTLEIADEGTGMHVLRDLYAKMKDDPYPVDLDGLWKELGVDMRADGKVVFDDKAPLAFVRRGMQAIASSGTSLKRP